MRYWTQPVSEGTQRWGILAEAQLVLIRYHLGRDRK